MLTVYGNKSGGSQLYWKEQHLYGSSRLGIWNADLLSTSSAATINSRWLQKGNKQFELSNHLGNVLAVITDKAKDSVIGGVVDHYEPEIFLAQDYYPFGMLQPDRQWGLANYRYGFNNKENDTEVKGNGNQQDYGMRVYDPRLGKFQSIDPLTMEYPELTPYQFAGNTPIQAIDLDGAETWMQQVGVGLNQKSKMRIHNNELLYWRNIGTIQPRNPNWAEKWKEWNDSKSPTHTWAIFSRLLYSTLNDAKITYTTAFDGKNAARGLDNVGVTNYKERIGAGLSTYSNIVLPVVFGEFAAAEKITSTPFEPFQRIRMADDIKLSLDGRFDGQIINGKIEFHNNVTHTNFDFVVTGEGYINLGKRHSFLSVSGSDVQAAGEMTIKNGQVLKVNNLSGHYRPDREQASNFLKILQKNGVNVDKTHLQIYNNKGNIIEHSAPNSANRANYINK